MLDMDEVEETEDEEAVDDDDDELDEEERGESSIVSFALLLFRFDLPFTMLCSKCKLFSLFMMAPAAAGPLCLA